MTEETKNKKNRIVGIVKEVYDSFKELVKLATPIFVGTYAVFVLGNFGILKWRADDVNKSKQLAVAAVDGTTYKELVEGKKDELFFETSTYFPWYVDAVVKKNGKLYHMKIENHHPLSMKLVPVKRTGEYTKYMNDIKELEARLNLKKKRIQHLQQLRNTNKAKQKRGFRHKY